MELIRRLDALALQSLRAQEQDRITRVRKDARDHQFRLRCADRSNRASAVKRMTVRTPCKSSRSARSNIEKVRTDYSRGAAAVLCLLVMEAQDVELFAEERALLVALRAGSIAYPKKSCCVDWAASLIEYDLAEEDAKGMLRITDTGRDQVQYQASA